MIRTATLVCVLSFATSAAFASTGTTSTAPRHSTATQVAQNMQSNPMDANARMKKKKMKGGMVKKDMGTGMDNGMSGTASKGNGMNGGMNNGMTK